MKISFASPALPKTGVLILLVAEGGGLTGLSAEADRRSSGQVSRAMEAAGCTGRRDTTLDIVAPGGGFSRIVLFGVGSPGALRPLDLEMLGGATAGVLRASTASAKAACVKSCRFGQSRACITSASYSRGIGLQGERNPPGRKRPVLETLLNGRPRA